MGRTPPVQPIGSPDSLRNLILSSAILDLASAIRASEHFCAESLDLLACLAEFFRDIFLCQQRKAAEDHGTTLTGKGKLLLQ